MVEPLIIRPVCNQHFTYKIISRLLKRSTFKKAANLRKRPFCPRPNFWPALDLGPCLRGLFGPGLGFGRPGPAPAKIEPFLLIFDPIFGQKCPKNEQKFDPIFEPNLLHFWARPQKMDHFWSILAQKWASFMPEPLHFWPKNEQNWPDWSGRGTRAKRPSYEGLLARDDLTKSDHFWKFQKNKFFLKNQKKPAGRPNRPSDFDQNRQNRISTDFDRPGRGNYAQRSYLGLVEKVDFCRLFSTKWPNLTKSTIKIDQVDRFDRP